VASRDFAKAIRRFLVMKNIVLKTKPSRHPIEARSLLGLDVSPCRSSPTPTHIITLNYLISSNY